MANFELQIFANFSELEYNKRENFHCARHLTATQPSSVYDNTTDRQSKLITSRSSLLFHYTVPEYEARTLAYHTGQ